MSLYNTSAPESHDLTSRYPTQNGPAVGFSQPQPENLSSSKDIYSRAMLTSLRPIEAGLPLTDRRSYLCMWPNAAPPAGL